MQVYKRSGTFPYFAVIDASLTYTNLAISYAPATACCFGLCTVDFPPTVSVYPVARMYCSETVMQCGRFS